MLEGSRGKRDFKLLYKPILVQKWINKPNFKSSVLINEESNIFFIEMAKINVKLDKPIQVGMSVLDLSKAHMTEFHYGVMKPLFPNPGQLHMVYTDTDSFIYEISGINEDLYKILSLNKSHFDFSDYPEEHICFDESNKKVLGKFKYEASGAILLEFIGLRPKLYTLAFHDKTHMVCHIQNDCSTLEKEEVFTIKKAKGVKKDIVKNNLTPDDYSSALFFNETREVTQSSIRSTPT